MRFAFSKSFTASLAVAFLSIASASAAVPSLEWQGLPAPTEIALDGVQLASVCGNWQPNAYNESEDCLALWTGADPDWVRQGDGGSQDRTFEARQSVSSSQASEAEDADEGDGDQEPPCLC